MDVTKLDIRENKFADHARHVNPLRKEVPAMPREKFKTLTEQMFYILLCLCEERCGIEILDSVKDLTDDRVKIFRYPVRSIGAVHKGGYDLRDQN